MVANKVVQLIRARVRRVIRRSHHSRDSFIDASNRPDSKPEAWGQLMDVLPWMPGNYPVNFANVGSSNRKQMGASRGIISPNVDLVPTAAERIIEAKINPSRATTRTDNSNRLLAYNEPTPTPSQADF